MLSHALGCLPLLASRADPCSHEPNAKGLTPPPSAQAHWCGCAKSPCQGFLLGSRPREEPVAKTTKKLCSPVDFGLSAVGHMAVVAFLTSAQHGETR